LSSRPEPAAAGGAERSPLSRVAAVACLPGLWPRFSEKFFTTPLTTLCIYVYSAPR
jgi:hypothetical protein